MKVPPSSNISRVGVSFVAGAFETIGFTFREQTVADYGIDAHIEIITDGMATGRLLAMQIKSGLSYFEEMNENIIIYRGTKEHLEYWLNFSLPVIIVLYHPETNRIYWQVVNENTVVKTEKAWRLEIPLHQQIDERNKPLIEKLTLPAEKPELLEFKDYSTPQYKRYEARAIVPPNFKKNQIEQVIMNYMSELRVRKYHRNDITNQHWQNQSAHVIILYIFTSLKDFSTNNWRCQSVWLDRPYLNALNISKFTNSFEKESSEHIGDNIILNWSHDYEVWKKIYEQTELTKEEYLAYMEAVKKPLFRLTEQIIDITQRYENNGLSDNEYQHFMQSVEPKISDLYMEGIKIGSPPYECRAVHNRFQLAIGVCHNIVLPFAATATRDWRDKASKYLFKSEIKRYYEEKMRLEFELEKVI